jgi:hypothetical protein
LVVEFISECASMNDLPRKSLNLDNKSERTY